MNTYVFSFNNHCKILSELLKIFFIYLVREPEKSKCSLKGKITFLYVSNFQKFLYSLLFACEYLRFCRCNQISYSKFSILTIPSCRDVQKGKYEFLSSQPPECNRSKKIILFKISLHFNFNQFSLHAFFLFKCSKYVSGKSFKYEPIKIVQERTSF